MQDSMASGVVWKLAITVAEPFVPEAGVRTRSRVPDRGTSWRLLQETGSKSTSFDAIADAHPGDRRPRDGVVASPAKSRRLGFADFIPPLRADLHSDCRTSTRPRARVSMSIVDCVTIYGLNRVSHMFTHKGTDFLHLHIVPTTR